MGDLGNVTVILKSTLQPTNNHLPHAPLQLACSVGVTVTHTNMRRHVTTTNAVLRLKRSIAKEGFNKFADTTQNGVYQGFGLQRNEAADGHGEGEVNHISAAIRL